MYWLFYSFLLSLYDVHLQAYEASSIGLLATDLGPVSAQ